MCGGRLACVVPGCKRTRLADGLFDEWVCARHWPAVPLRYRRAYARAKRKRRSPAALARLWRICRREAIEQALIGLGL